MNNKKEIIIEKDVEKRINIRKKVIFLEKYNYNQKEFTPPEMVSKIKKFIEEEVNKWLYIL